MIALIVCVCVSVMYSINGGFAHYANSLIEAVVYSGVRISQVESINIVEGVISKEEFMTIAKDYPALHELKMERSATIEGDGIPASAFRLGRIEHVVINNLKTVGREAFYNCTTLVEFLSDTLEQVNISGFRFCRGLKSVSLPNLKVIKNYGFMNCTNLENVSIPKIERIECNAFHYDLGLKEIDIATCTYIGTEAFRETGLATVAIGPGLTTVCDSVFYNCSFLSCPIAMDNVKSLGMMMFINCIRLTSVSAATAEEIGKMCFLNCSALKTVTIPKAKRICYEAFFNTPYLGGIELPSVEVIESWTFWKSALSKFESGSLMVLGQQTFRDCRNLSSVTIPNIEKVETQTFDNCRVLTSATLKQLGGIRPKAFRNCTRLTTFDAQQVKVVGNHSFQNCYSLETVQIPNVQEVGNFTFESSGIREFIAPNLVAVAERAFLNCTFLKTVYIGEKLESLGFSVFWECWKLTNATLLSNVNLTDRTNQFKDCPLEYFHFATSVTGLFFTPASNVVGIISKSGDYCPPGAIYTIQTYATHVDAGAFKDCAELETVRLFSTVQEIGSEAFSGCSTLTKLDAPDGGALTRIGDDAFSNCISLKDISFPKAMKEVGKKPFDGDIALEKIQVHKVFEVEKYRAELLTGNSAQIVVSY